MRRAAVREHATRTLLASLACCLVVACSNGPHAGGAAADVAAVERVVEAFRLAIVHRDKAAYMALFFSDKPEDIGWQAVVDDPWLENLQKTRPPAVKARPIPANNFVALIDGAVASKAPQEERISNVHVYTDGEVASAVFDYVYLSDGKATNQGSEHWQLVRTERGWKIFSVVYTIRSPADGPRPLE